MRLTLTCLFAVLMCTATWAQQSTFLKVYPEIDLIFSPTLIFEHMPGQYVINSTQTGLYFTNDQGDIGKTIESRFSSTFAKTDHVLNEDSSFTVVGFDGTCCGGNTNIGKYNKFGNKVWEHIHGDGTLMLEQTISKTADGGYVIGGLIETVPRTSLLMKINEDGDSLWIKSAPGIGSRSIHETSNGNLVMVVKLNGREYLYKTNALGDSLWLVDTRSGGTGIDNLLIKDDTIYHVRQSGSTNYIQTYDLDGNLLKSVPYEADNAGDQMHPLQLFQTADGGYVIVGNYINSVSGLQVNNSYVYLIKVNHNLTEVSRSYQRDPNYTFVPNRASQTSDGGYLICGTYNVLLPAPQLHFLTKLDASGNIYTTFINGTVYNDENQDCEINQNEDVLSDVVVRAEGANGTYYGYADSRGFYSINVDTGTYQLEFFSLSDYWESVPCNQNQVTVAASIAQDTTQLNYGFTTIIPCPMLEVELATGLIRPCFTTTIPHYISYCNNGTLPASNVYIDLTLDPFLTLTGASVNYTSLGSNVFRFNVGTVGVGQCGSIQFFTFLDCNLDIGATHCIEAHIYPDTLCYPPNPNWSGASLDLEATCVSNNSVIFEVTNNGLNMTEPSSYRIFEDDQLFETGTIQLGSGATSNKVMNANGSTWTMDVQQVSDHPGFSHPIKTIEGCGTNSTGGYSMGYTIQFPQDDDNPFNDIDCLESTSAVDPNDKTPTPLGLGVNGLIEDNQQIDYRIRFQNTGTDTAFTIIIRDTLSPLLDITSLHLIDASHEYTFSMNRGREIVWQFDNVLLPDSNVNEPGSHGFVSFSIDQIDGLAPGSVILNRAGIYFDYNEVVLTNTTKNTIVDSLFVDVSVAVSESFSHDKPNRFYPNPNYGQLLIDVSDIGAAEVSVHITDVYGRTALLKDYTIDSGVIEERLDFSKGIYFYQMISNSGLISEGTLILY